MAVKLLVIPDPQTVDSSDLPVAYCSRSFPATDKQRWHSFGHNSWQCWFRRAVGNDQDLCSAAIVLVTVKSLGTITAPEVWN